MEVRIFTKFTHRELEEAINNFIKNKIIIDIKFQVTSNLANVLYYAMIIYKEDKSE